MRIEQFDQLGEVGQRPRQTVDLVDDDDVDLPGANIIHLMKDCTAHDLREAITILEDQALWAGKLSEIGERHHASDDESIRDVLIRAAAAGDEEAKALIACDLLELKMY